MSWSLDVRRPKPEVDPEGWYKFWEEELEWSFSRPEERLVKDKDAREYMIMVSEQYLLYFRQMRLEIASHRQNMAKIWLDCYSKGHPVEERWESRTRKEREKVMVDALVQYATSGRPATSSEDMWQWCPEVIKEDMCSGKGEGFIRLFNHFKIADPLSKPSLDFPVLKEWRVWRLFDISMDDAANARRPEGVRGFHNFVIVNRHVLLANVVLNVLMILVGKKMVTQQYLKIPKVKKTEEFKELVKATKEWKPLPEYVQAAMRADEAKTKKAQRKLTFRECCAFCQEEGDKADLKSCGGCNKVGRRVLYCSRDCQVQDYKHGRPPHKQICSKPLREAPLDLASEPTEAELEAIPLYTTTPTPALALQAFYLRRDQYVFDYYFTQTEDGKPVTITFHQPHKANFLEARKNAMEKHELPSIAVVELMLSCRDSSLTDESSNFVAQIEAEYEVDIEECRKEAVKRSKVYRELVKFGFKPKARVVR